MKIIILAAGQGTRLRPLTDDKPKCMVEIKGKSIIERQIETMRQCGIQEEDIYIITGYREEELYKLLHKTNINFIKNIDFETTNMVCSFMCAEDIIKKSEDVIISYGDIIYSEKVFHKLIDQEEDLSVIVDDGWYDYWAMRNSNPLDDAETLIIDTEGYIVEIGQKTKDINKIQSQYIGLLRFQNDGINRVLNLCKDARERSENGLKLWRTTRNYNMIYMTDMLQGLIDEGGRLKAIPINRGWYEIDCIQDLEIAEKFVV